MKTGLVISDLHLFSGRSEGDTLFRDLLPTLTTKDVLVLNGDTFDFRWSTLPDEESTLQAAATWLDDQLDTLRDLETHYVLGNHDCLTTFRKILADLKTRHPNLHLYENDCRLGRHLFLHGDCSNWGMTPAKLTRYREHWSTDAPRGKLSKRLYRLVDASGLGMLFHRLYFREKPTVERVERFLKGRLEGIEHCYFGHTHVPFERHQQNGVTYHNTGSGIRGMGFLPQSFVID